MIGKSGLTQMLENPNIKIFNLSFAAKNPHKHANSTQTPQ